MSATLNAIDFLNFIGAIHECAVSTNVIVSRRLGAIRSHCNSVNL
jgi:hypothetical protein